MESVLCLFLVLLFVISSDSAPPNICRVTGYYRISCPSDYHCCGNDECCKLTFGNEDEESTPGEFSEHSGGFHKMEPLLILVRIIIITILVSFGYFISRYIKCKALKPDIRRFTLPSLPRYKHLNKESATSLSVATLVGSPYHETSISTVAGQNGTHFAL